MSSVWVIEADEIFTSQKFIVATFLICFKVLLKQIAGLEYQWILLHEVFLRM